MYRRNRLGNTLNTLIVILLFLFVSVFIYTLDWNLRIAVSYASSLVTIWWSWRTRRLGELVYTSFVLSLIMLAVVWWFKPAHEWMWDEAKNFFTPVLLSGAMISSALCLLTAAAIKFALDFAVRRSSAVRA